MALWKIRRKIRREFEALEVAIQERIGFARGAMAPVIKAVWADHEDEQYRRDMSHWRGAGRWQDEARWLRLGERVRGSVETAYRLAGAQDMPNDLRILEWGPGGGANLVALRGHAREIYGVDVSISNLEECARVLRESDFDAFTAIPLDGPPASVLGHIEGKIELIVCHRVFQHFPTLGYADEVLRVFSQLLADDGLATIQIRYDDGDRYQPKPLRTYAQTHITQTSFKLDGFWRSLVAAGLTPLAVVEVVPETAYATFLVRAGAPTDSSVD